MGALIVIIDNDDDDRELLRQAVKENNEHSECITYANSQQALKALLSQDAVVPDLIFLDYNMPQINGRECLTTLKADQRYLTVKVVMISTTFTDNTRSQLIGHGAYQVLVKPESLALTVSQVKRLFES